MIRLTRETFLQHLEKQPPYIFNTLHQESLEVANIMKMTYPIIGDQCAADACAVDFQVVHDALNSKGEYICSSCAGKYQSHEKFMRHSLFYQIVKEFHPQTQRISVIQQKLTVQIHRPKNFLDQLRANNMKMHIDHLFATARSSNNLSQKAKRQEIFYSRCILDRVQIVIPVRHKNCKHQQCYELSSLINYQINSKLDIQNCLCSEDMCQSIFELDSLANLFKDLVFDDELFQLIKRSPPYTMEFIYDKAQQQYQSFFNLSDNIDPQIVALYSNLKGSEFYDKIEVFQNEVLADYTRVIAEDQEANLGKKLNQKQAAVKGERFKKIDFKLKDRLTERKINWVGRCIHCQFSQIFDLKSTIARYKLEKLKNRTNPEWKFTCPACNNQFKSDLTILRLFFSDSFLTEAFVRNNGVYDEESKVFKYDGEKAMLLEFKSRHRITEQQMKEQNKGNEKLTFPANQSIYSQKILENPLILMKCEQQGRIDFSDFYQVYSENGFQFVNPDGKYKAGLTFCKCESCNLNPITNFYPFIYYDELYAHVLSKANLSNSVKSILFDISNGAIEVDYQEASKNFSKGQAILNPPPLVIGGFSDMISSEEYQNLFKKQELIKGQIFEVQTVETPYIKYEKGRIQAQVNKPQNSTQTSAQGGYSFSVVTQKVTSHLTNQVFSFPK